MCVHNNETEKKIHYIKQPTGHARFNILKNFLFFFFGLLQMERFNELREEKNRFVVVADEFAH